MSKEQNTPQTPPAAPAESAHTALGRLVVRCLDNSTTTPCPEDAVLRGILERQEPLSKYPDILHHMTHCTACRQHYLNLAAALQQCPPTAHKAPFPAASPASRPARLWKGLAAAACVCLMLTGLWAWQRHGQSVTPPQITPQFMPLLTQLGEDLRALPASRSGNSLPWEGLALGHMHLNSAQKALAAGMWQGRQERTPTLTKPFPILWKTTADQAPDAWKSTANGNYFALGYALYATEAMCTGRRAPSSRALRQLAAAVDEASLEPTPALLDFANTLRDEQSTCAPLLEKIRRVETWLLP